MAPVVHRPAHSLLPAHPGLAWQPCAGCSCTVPRLAMAVLELLATSQACLCHLCPLPPRQEVAPPRLVVMDAWVTTAPPPPQPTVTTRHRSLAIGFPAMRRLAATGSPRSRGASRSGEATTAATAMMAHRLQHRGEPSGLPPTASVQKPGISALQLGGASEGTAAVSRLNPASMSAGTRREVWRTMRPHPMWTHVRACFAPCYGVPRCGVPRCGVV